jgi:type I restriction enzyme S subunit
MNWETGTLGQLCNVRIGRTPRRDSPQFWGGTVVWVTVGELNGGIITDSEEHISDLAVSEVMPAPTAVGTLLFSFKLSIGKMAIAGVPLYTNEAIASLEIRDPTRLDRDFLRFALMASSSEVDANHAVLGKVLNKAKVEGISIPLPPFDEQWRIVDLLSRAEGIVRLRREAQKKVAEIIPALFLDMFGDPATNPNEWPVSSLGEHIDLLTGYAFKSSEFVSRGDSVRLCRGANVLPQCIDWSDVRYWPNEKASEFERFLLAAGDIVLAMDRPWISTGLKVARMTNNDVPALLVQRVARIRPKDTLVHAYIYAALCHDRFTAHCNAVKTETLVPHISPHDIRSFPIVVAPIAQQRRFAYLTEQMQSIASQQQEGLAKAEATFNALLAKMFAYDAAKAEQRYDAGVAA